MASKELFHSNMLYWISLAYRTQFQYILNQLGVDTSTWPNDWKSYREKNHFDLSVYAKTDGKEECSLIVENKVKSIPYTEQLDVYTKKVESKTYRLLLSLATDLPNSKYINNSGWIIKNYQDFANAIYDVLPSITDCYHRSLLLDYCMVIRYLHGKQLLWRYDYDDNYRKKFVDESTEEKSLRIEDMRKKVLYSRLAGDLQKRLNARLFTNNQISESKNEGDSGIYINYGMTRSVGLLDVKIRIEGNFMFVIQLQGEAYRHCVETLDKEGITLVNEVKLRLADNNPDANESYPFIDVIVSKFLSPLDNISDINKYPFEKKCFNWPNTRKTKQGDSRAYNQYGQTFIYQYVKITNEATVKDVINGIITDVNRVQDILGNNQFNLV